VEEGETRAFERREDAVTALLDRVTLG